jgi:hypothetical protein
MKETEKGAETMEDNKMKELTLTATHYYDTKRFSRYEIDAGQEATGRVYVDKDGKVERVVISLGKKRSEVKEEEG